MLRLRAAAATSSHLLASACRPGAPITCASPRARRTPHPPQVVRSPIDRCDSAAVATQWLHRASRPTDLSRLCPLSRWCLRAQPTHATESQRCCCSPAQVDGGTSEETGDGVTARRGARGVGARTADRRGRGSSAAFWAAGCAARCSTRTAACSYVAPLPVCPPHVAPRVTSTAQLTWSTANPKRCAGFSSLAIGLACMRTHPQNASLPTPAQFEPCMYTPRSSGLGGGRRWTTRGEGDSDG